MAPGSGELLHPESSELLLRCRTTLFDQINFLLIIYSEFNIFGSLYFTFELPGCDAGSDSSDNVMHVVLP